MSTTEYHSVLSGLYFSRKLSYYDSWTLRGITDYNFFLGMCVCAQIQSGWYATMYHLIEIGLINGHLILILSW